MNGVAWDVFQRFFPPLERYTPDAISKASGPLILTIPIPDALMAVEIAAIVVSSIFTLLCQTDKSIRYITLQLIAAMPFILVQRIKTSG